LDALTDDPDRLEDLIEPDLIAVEHVAVLGIDHVEVDVFVREVRLRLSQIPREAGGPQDGTGRAQGERLLGRDEPDTDGPLAPDRVLAQQSVILGHAALDRLAQRQRVLLPVVRHVGGDAARTDEVVVHPEAGDRLKKAECELALAPAVDDHRHRAEVQPVGGLEQEV
jgi:hypothetical protein